METPSILRGYEVKSEAEEEESRLADIEIYKDMVKDKVDSNLPPMHREQAI